jgi:hypothetical protein
VITGKMSTKINLKRAYKNRLRTIEIVRKVKRKTVPYGRSHMTKGTAAKFSSRNRIRQLIVVTRTKCPDWTLKT